MTGIKRHFENVTVLGTGVLGSQIAYQTAYSGFPVTAWDISDERLDTAKNSLEQLAAIYEQEVDGAAGGPARAALARIDYTTDLAEAARYADLVIECVTEKLALKREVYVQLGRVAPQGTIFASNSSMLLPSELADSTGRPDRFLAMHFANQIWKHNTAEIMGHAGTDPDIYQAVVGFARQIGMEPIEVHKEQRGYVLNSLLTPWMDAAEYLLMDGVAEPATIDKTWRIASGMPQGPCEVMDMIGLATIYNVNTVSGNEKSRAAGAWLKQHYIDQGKLGRTSGEGFYKYTDQRATGEAG
ncbi:3-hydroxyacyl-CoA dehydrogenase [Bradyrhizobium sp. CB2312]|uniref:3-hydroxyacyl-CoA dehydrogenase n=1 Tax=Bradyrhizobium sp. CB2312 TaxID=3039155 RepID=UPI0024B19864|nr:3-hydroxyacyl-CoA dehydrogenase [Bradyrhizobium sp. CB2312]WFU75553.1 3-hydroxyacyl-CoA dehydrogenase [Bradyrhizobium sp. CB2312]